MSSSRLVIIGASDAGISAAPRAREFDPAVDVTVLAADAYPDFLIRGLPCFLAGDVLDWGSLAYRGWKNCVRPNGTAARTHPPERAER